MKKLPAKKQSNAKKYRSHGMRKTKQELEQWMDFAYFTIDLLQTAHNFCSFVEELVEGRPEDKE